MSLLPNNFIEALALVARCKELRPMDEQDRMGFAGVEDPNAMIGEIENQEERWGMTIIVEEGCLGFYLNALDPRSANFPDTQWVQFDVRAGEPYGNRDGIY